MLRRGSEMIKKTPHRWCNEIVHWANGGAVQWLDAQVGEWVDCDKLTPPDWTSPNVTYRIKPEPSERSYPESSLTHNEIIAIFDSCVHERDGFKAIANAAVKRYIQDIEEGDV